MFGRIAMEQKLMPADLMEKYGEKVAYYIFFPSQPKIVEKRVCTIHCMYLSSLKASQSNTVRSAKGQEKEELPWTGRSPPRHGRLLLMILQRTA